MERCLRMLQVTKNSIKDVALQKELANIGHVNLLPNERPKWLILELEGDYLMRSIQLMLPSRCYTHLAMRMLFYS